MIYLFSHLAGFAFLFGLFMGTGYRISKIIKISSDERFLQFLIFVTLGIIVWIYAIFILASLRLLRPVITFPLIALIGLASMKDVLPHLKKALSSIKRFFANLAEMEWESKILSIVIFSVLLLLFLCTASPSLSWDDDVYHLNVPKIYLTNGGFLRIPYNVYSNWPMNFEMLYALGMMVQDYVTSKLIHYGFGILSVMAIFYIGRNESSLLSPCIATLLFLGNRVVLFEFTTAYVDLAMTFFFLMAFIFFEKYRAKEERQDLILCALCCGVLIGGKYLGLLGMISLWLLLMLHWMSRKTRPRILLKNSFLFLAISLALSVPWQIKSFCFTSNPVYPFAYSLFDGIEWNPELSQKLMDWQLSIGMGRHMMDYIKLPFRLIFMSGPGYSHFDGHLSRWWGLLLPLSIIPLFQQKRSRRYLLIALIYFILWSLSSQQLRFLIPALPFISLLSASGLMALRSFVKKRSSRKLASLFLILFAPVVIGMNGYEFGQAGYEIAKSLPGHSSEEIFSSAVPPLYRFINSGIDPSSRLMFLNINFGFFCQKPYIADSFFEASQMNMLLKKAQSEEGLKETLKKMGITHILYSTRDWKIDYPSYLQELLKKDAERIGQTEDGHLILFRIL